MPLVFKRMGERPEVLISHLLYKGTVAQTSPLDPKYVELISMAVGAALKCPHCTGYHMQAAIRMGATREEILEVILLSGHDLELVRAGKCVPDHRREAGEVHPLRDEGCGGREGGCEEEAPAEGNEKEVRTHLQGSSATFAVPPPPLYPLLLKTIRVWHQKRSRPSAGILQRLRAP